MVELYIVHKILELLLCPEIMFLAFLLYILRHKEGLARDVWQELESCDYISPLKLPQIQLESYKGVSSKNQQFVHLVRL